MIFRTVLLLIYFACSLNGKYFIIETEDKLEHEQGSGNHIADDYQDDTTNKNGLVEAPDLNGKVGSVMLTREEHCSDHCDCEMRRRARLPILCFDPCLMHYKIFCKL